MSFLNEMLPETAEAFGQLRNSIFKDSFLDVKTKELIAVAVRTKSLQAFPFSGFSWFSYLFLDFA